VERFKQLVEGASSPFSLYPPAAVHGSVAQWLGHSPGYAWAPVTAVLGPGESNEVQLVPGGDLEVSFELEIPEHAKFRVRLDQEAAQDNSQLR
jgi:hypothetical protein